MGTEPVEKEHWMQRRQEGTLALGKRRENSFMSTQMKPEKNSHQSLYSKRRNPGKVASAKNASSRGVFYVDHEWSLNE